MSKFISVEAALRSILTQIPSTTSERVHLVDASSRHLAETISAPFNAPRFDNSAMDGYALQFRDIQQPPVTLPIAGASSAGHPSTETLKAGTAFRISTGAAIPGGADTVVPRELCTARDGEVTIDECPEAGQGANIRRAGTYLRAGQPVLHRGDPLGPAEVGLLASFAKSVVEVHRRPRVAVISTGDELVELGVSPGPGQIVNSNAYMLEALLKRCGALPRVFPIVGDDRQAIETTFRAAIAESDLVLSSGGVSVGDHDHVKEVLDALSDGMDFWKIRMKPGKPLAFGIANKATRPVPLIGLPGNPASSFVGFQLFVRPALAVAQGADIDAASLHQVRATLAPGDPIRGSRGRRVYTAGQIRSGDEGLIFVATAQQSSGNPALFAGANALGIVEEGQAQIRPDERIDVLLL